MIYVSPHTSPLSEVMAEGGAIVHIICRKYVSGFQRLYEWVFGIPSSTAHTRTHAHTHIHTHIHIDVFTNARMYVSSSDIETRVSVHSSDTVKSEGSLPKK